MRPARPPLLVKLAPDLADAGLAAIVEACIAERVDGLIISNTTISRPPGLKSPQMSQPGGLSGAPLFTLSTTVLRRVAEIAAGRLVLIGAGGVFSGVDMLAKIRAGASLVQLYSGFAYGGPAMIPRLKRELLAALDDAGVDESGLQADQLARSGQPLDGAQVLALDLADAHPTRDDRLAFDVREGPQFLGRRR